MQFEIFTSSPARITVDCLVVGVHDNGELSAAAAAIDRQCNGALGRFLKRGDFPGRLAETLLLPAFPRLKASRARRRRRRPLAHQGRKCRDRTHPSRAAGARRLSFRSIGSRDRARRALSGERSEVRGQDSRTRAVSPCVRSGTPIRRCSRTPRPRPRQGLRPRCSPDARPREPAGQYLHPELSR